MLTSSTCRREPVHASSRARARLSECVCAAGAAARHSSPCTRTMPVIRVRRARPARSLRPLRPISSSLPVAGFHARERSTSAHQDNRRSPRTAAPRPAPRPGSRPSPVSGERISISAPSTMDTTPPTPSTPCVGYFASRINSASASTISSKPVEVHRQHVHREQRQHQRDSADHARRKHSRMRELGVQAEHADNQQNEENVRLHDARRETSRARSCPSRPRPDLRSASCVVEPSKRVIVRPSSFASKSSGDGAIRSISLPSSASFSVNAFASVTAVAARSALRPRLAT